MNDLRKRKQKARENAVRIRNAQTNRAALSETVIRRLLRSPALEATQSLCCYVSFRSEVSTRALIDELIVRQKEVCVPFCDGDVLTVWAIESWQDLKKGSFGIEEPSASIRKSPDRQRKIGDVQLAIVPGLAFTELGDRLGYGRGYYDKLLGDCDVLKVALAFDCQLISELPTNDNDVRMDIVYTPTREIEISPISD